MDNGSDEILAEVASKRGATRYFLDVDKAHTYLQ